MMNLRRHLSVEWKAATGVNKMAYNHDRATGCRIGYNSIIKAVKYVKKHGQIDPRASRHVRRVLKVIYGDKRYHQYRCNSTRS